MTRQDLIIVIVFIWVCILSLPSVSADTPSEMASSWRQKGDDFFLQERYNESLQCYEMAIGYDPYHAITWNRLGLARMALSDYEGAIRAFDRSIALDAPYISPWNNRGDAYSSMGEYEAAIESYNGALAINSNDLYALLHKGMNLQQSGHSDQAMKVYEEVIRIAEREVRKHPNDAKYDAGLWTNKGDALYQLGRYDEAREAFETALGINPKFEGAVEGMERIDAIRTESNVSVIENGDGYELPQKTPTSTAIPLHVTIGALAFGCAAVLAHLSENRNGGRPPH